MSRDVIEINEVITNDHVIWSLKWTYKNFTQFPFTLHSSTSNSHYHELCNKDNRDNKDNKDNENNKDDRDDKDNKDDGVCHGFFSLCFSILFTI